MKQHYPDDPPPAEPAWAYTVLAGGWIKLCSGAATVVCRWVNSLHAGCIHRQCGSFFLLLPLFFPFFCRLLFTLQHSFTWDTCTFLSSATDTDTVFLFLFSSRQRGTSERIHNYNHYYNCTCASCLHKSACTVMCPSRSCVCMLYDASIIYTRETE